MPTLVSVFLRGVNGYRIISFPPEDEPPLVVDTQAPIVAKATSKLFQPITGRYLQEVQAGRSIELVHQPSRPLVNFAWDLAGLAAVDAVVNVLRRLADHVPNNGPSIPNIDIHVNPRAGYPFHPRGHRLG